MPRPAERWRDDLAAARAEWLAGRRARGLGGARGAGQAAEPAGAGAAGAGVQSDDRRPGGGAARRARNPILWRIYENSLTLALLLLFIVFFLAHAYGAWMSLNEHRSWLHQAQLGFGEVFTESNFWFESFQNWQSEFFSIAILGGFSIFLRQKHSPQSKKMRDSHWKTGGE